MLIDSPLRPPRLLGDDVAPPRARYISHIPAILALSGVVVWIISDESGMVAGSVIASVIACYMLWDWLFRAGPTRLSTITSMALLLGYGLGAFNTWFTLPRGGLSLAAFMGADSGVLARGMAAVLITSASLCFFGELYERPLFGRSFRIPLDESTYTFIYFGTLAIIIGFFTHSLGFEGSATGVGGETSVFTALLTWLLTPLVAVTAAVFLASPRGRPKVFSGICTLILCVLLMAVGRRVLIYTAMEILFALRLTGYRVKGTVFKKFFLVSVLGACVLFGALFFMLIRLAGFQAPHSGQSSPGLVPRLQVIEEWIEDGTALSRTTGASQSNVQKRTFVLGFFADVLEGSSQNRPAFGEDLLGYVQFSIPRVLYPDKNVYFSEEQLDDALFGLAYTDAANSLLTNGATDFGFIGVIVYPLFAVYLMLLFVKVISRFLPVLPVSIVALSVIYVSLQTENHLAFVFVTLRNGIIFSAILFVLFRLPRIRLRS